MTTKKQKSFLVVLLIIIGFFFISRGNLGFLDVTGTPNLCSGQILSITPQIQLTNSNELSTQVIRATYVVGNQGAECLKLKISEQQLEGAIPNFNANDDVFIDIRLINQEKTFNINEQGGSLNIFKTPLSINIGNELICSQNRCNDQANPGPNTAYLASLFNYLPGSDCNCLYQQNRGPLGTFASSSSLRWITEVKVGDLSPVQLTQSLSSAQIGNIATVKWIGNLQSNANLDTISGNWKAYRPYNVNQWRIIPSTATSLLNQFTTLSSGLISCDQTQIIASLVSCQNIVSQLAPYLGTFNEQTSNQIANFVSQEQFVDDAQIQNNELIVDLVSPIAYPTFTVDLKASEVGIFQTIGEPEVTCPNKLNIQSGQIGTANFEVENVGSSSGSFMFEASCNDGSLSLSPTGPTSVPAGNSINVQGSFSWAVTSGSDTTQCHFTARDVNNPSNSDICNVGLTSTAVTTCQVGSQICEIGNTELWTCQQGGTYDRQVCSNGCAVLNGQAQCLAQVISPRPQPSGECSKIFGFIPNVPCLIKKAFQGVFDFLYTLKLTLIFAISTISIFITEKVLRNLKSFRGRKGARWFIAIGISLGLGITLYQFLGGPVFWGIVIGSFVYLFFADKIIKIFKR